MQPNFPVNVRFSRQKPERIVACYPKLNTSIPIHSSTDHNKLYYYWFTQNLNYAWKPIKVSMDDFRRLHHDTNILYYQLPNMILSQTMALTFWI